MAGPCIITYQGKKYPYHEFAVMLHDGLLNELVSQGIVDDSSFVGTKPAVSEVKVTEKVEAAPKEVSAEEKYLIDQAAYKKPSIKMEFVSGKDLASAKKPLEAKNKHDKIKEDFKNLKQLIDCIWL